MIEQPDNMDAILARARQRHEREPPVRIAIIGGPHDGGYADVVNPAGISIPVQQPDHYAYYEYPVDGAYHYTRTMPSKELGQRASP